jgi:hypothetical protein
MSTVREGVFAAMRDSAPGLGYARPSAASRMAAEHNQTTN